MRTNDPAAADRDASYYAFTPLAGFHVILLDGYDVSLMGWRAGHPRRAEAAEILARRNPNKENQNSPAGPCRSGALARARKKRECPESRSLRPQPRRSRRAGGRGAKICRLQRCRRRPAAAGTGSGGGAGKSRYIQFDLGCSFYWPPIVSADQKERRFAELSCCGRRSGSMSACRKSRPRARWPWCARTRPCTRARCRPGHR